jgi:hypothetical protein
MTDTILIMSIITLTGLTGICIGGMVGAVLSKSRA